MPAALSATDGTLPVQVTVSRVTGSQLEEEVVEGRAMREFFLEFSGFGGEIDVRQLAHGGFELGDGGHRGQHALDLALGFGAKEFRQDGINNHERSRYGGIPQFLFYSVMEDGRCGLGLAEHTPVVLGDHARLGTAVSGRSGLALPNPRSVTACYNRTGSCEDSRRHQIRRSGRLAGKADARKPSPIHACDKVREGHHRRAPAR